MDDPKPPERPRLLQGFLSLLIPGLGQAIAGSIGRGIMIFLTTGTVVGLTIWTAAQKARFPDYGLSARATLLIALESAAIFIFIGAIYYLLRRSLVKDPATQAALRGLMILVAAAGISLVQDTLFISAVGEGMERELFPLTIVYGSALVAAIWLWNVLDATQIAGEYVPSGAALLLLGSLALLVLGTRVTRIDLPKAIREYRDTQIILRQIVWPWRGAFVYEADDVRAEARIQAPCPEGAIGPPVNEPKDEEPWIVVTPTCGETSERDPSGALTFGTEITIRAGNFEPNQIATIQWRNPIGNSFTPRGVGDVEIDPGEDGAFETTIYIPDVVIASTAQGPQLHTLSVVQRGDRRFTGELSQDMKLALQEMLVTIMMGMMATFVGVLMALPLSFLAARNLMSSVRSTAQGFVGGAFGLVVGGWLGLRLASDLSRRIGGLEGAPIPTLALYLLLGIGGAVLFYRLAGSGLDWLGRRALPETVALLITILGLGTIGAVVGNILGQLFARALFSVTHNPEVAVMMAPGIGQIGAVLAGATGAYIGYRDGPRAEITVGNLIYATVRVLMNIVRSIEPLILAVIGIIWVGPGPFAGFIALTAHTVAALGKLYSESIESIEPGPIEALQATGANRLQTIVYAVLPQVFPPFVSFTIYRWDINVRLSTIIGLVGGGGIGFLLIQWIRLFQYQQAGIAVWLITLTVATLDFASAEIRERFV